MARDAPMWVAVGPQPYSNTTTFERTAATPPTADAGEDDGGSGDGHGSPHGGSLAEGGGTQAPPMAAAARVAERVAERVLERNGQQGIGARLLVKWRDLPAAEATWEREACVPPALLR
eukprot:6324585-Prymnesium_polylepis.1